MPSRRIHLATVSDFDDDQLETEEDVRPAIHAVLHVIGVNAVKSDVTLATDL